MTSPRARCSPPARPGTANESCLARLSSRGLHCDLPREPDVRPPARPGTANESCLARLSSRGLHCDLPREPDVRPPARPGTANESCLARLSSRGLHCQPPPRATVRRLRSSQVCPNGGEKGVRTEQKTQQEDSMTARTRRGGNIGLAGGHLPARSERVRIPLSPGRAPLSCTFLRSNKELLYI